MLFSQAGILPLAIALMLAFGLFVKMSNGATYAVVPFINRRSLGTVAGVVGAGGNVGTCSPACSLANRNSGRRRCS